MTSVLTEQVSGTHGVGSDDYVAFLSRFCQDHESGIVPDTISSDVRGVVTRGGAVCEVQKEHLTTAEIEGECLDWTLAYLIKRSCPPLLAVQLARAVTDVALLAILADHTTIATCEVDGGPNKSSSQLNERADDHGGVKAADTINTASSIETSMLTTDVVVKHTTKAMHDVCQQWNVNLPSSVLFPSQRRVPLLTSTHAIKNTRRKMEDKHVLQPYLGELFNGSDMGSYYAVFDGHGGQEASRYASVHLHCQLVRLLQRPSADVEESLRTAFIQTDQMFIECAKRQGMFGGTAYTSGTTAVCVLVHGDKLHIAWLGDSQVMLVRDGRPIELMVPHKPEREDERKRIECLGGCVVYFGAWRVNGSLSVSRAIGDMGYKPYVSADADVASVELQSADNYLVLACDGLWDTLTPDDVVREVATHIHMGEDRTTVAQRLVRAAKDRGSSDNITATVVFLSDNIPPPPAAAESRTDNDSDSSRSSGAAEPHEDDHECEFDSAAGEGKNSQSGQELGQSGQVNSSNENSQLAMSVALAYETNAGEVAVDVSGDDSQDSSPEMEEDRGEKDAQEEEEEEGELRRPSQDSKRNVLEISDDVHEDEEWFGTRRWSPVAAQLIDCDHSVSNPIAYGSPVSYVIGHELPVQFDPFYSVDSPVSNVLSSSLHTDLSPHQATSNVSNPSSYNKSVLPVTSDNEKKNYANVCDSPLSRVVVQYKSPSLTAIGYESSPASNPGIGGRDSISAPSSTSQSAELVSSLDNIGLAPMDGQASDASGDMALAFHIGQAARRARHGRVHGVVTMKENRRPAGANVTPPCNPPSSVKSHEDLAQQVTSATAIPYLTMDTRRLSSYRASRCSLTSQSSCSLMLGNTCGRRGAVTGGGVSVGVSGPGAGRRPLNQGRWTIAVEVEGGAGMFQTESSMAASRTSATNILSHW